jgi:CCR4-NOT transcription complex subunit 6
MNYGSHMLSNAPATMAPSSVSTLSNGFSSNHQKQLEYANQSRIASAPHHHARIAANTSRAAAAAQSAQGSVIGRQSSVTESNSLMASMNENTENPSEWKSLDLGGMQVSNISPSRYQYDFLKCLYLNHNNLSSISSDISRLNCLVTLNLSSNKLSSLPPELGLLISLRELLVFDNQLSFLPPELGQLYQLNILGLEGNPMSEPIASMIQKDGTLAVVTYLRDMCPGIYITKYPDY